MPYSDNMYSFHDEDGDDIYQAEPVADGPGRANHSSDDLSEDHNLDDHALSPVDGYFHASQDHHYYSQESSTPTNTTTPYFPGAGTSADGDASSSSHHFRGPHVPDVWVEDPSLQGSTAVDKAREAEEERRAHLASLSDTPRTSPSTAHHPAPSSAAASTTSSGPAPTSTYTPTQHHRASSSATGRPSQQHQQHHRTTPSTSTTSHTTRSHTPAGTSSIYSERSALVSYADAPPAYTPSPTSPITNTSDFSRGYRTFSQASMGGRDEARGLLASAEPQSMGDHPVEDVEDGIVPRWRERVRRYPWLNWRNCRHFCLGLLLLLLTLGFLISVMTAGNERKSGLPIEKDPDNVVTRPKDPSEILEPEPDKPTSPPASYPTNPPASYPTSYPAYDEVLQFPSTMCQGRHDYKKVFNLNFDSARNLILQQQIDKLGNNGNYHMQVSGDIIFRRLVDGSPRIDIDIAATHESIGVRFDFDESVQTLIITTPDSINEPTATPPCVTIRATVWVPEGGTMEFIEIDTVQLGVKLLDNLSMQGLSMVKLSTISGKVMAAYSSTMNNERLMHDGPSNFFTLDSRNIEVHTISASIQGSWPLYDSLKLASTSGTISAGIVPKPAGPKPKPAYLSLKTISASIQFWEPIHQAQEAFRLQKQGLQYSTKAAEDILPPRDYQVEVKSTSGTIKGAVAFSYAAHVHSVSGSQGIDYLPVLPSKLGRGYVKQVCELETATTSGTTVVRLFDPLWVDKMDEQGAKYIVGRDMDPIFMPPKRNDGQDSYIPVRGRDPYDIIRGSQPAAEVSKRQQEGNQSANSKSPVYRVLNSRHSAMSGSMTLQYPASWLGDIDLGSISGSMTVNGKDIHDIRRDPYKHYHAIKGDVNSGEGSAVSVQTTSGSIKLGYPIA